MAGPVDLETGEGVAPEVWELIHDLQLDVEELILKNAALAGSVTHLQKQQMQFGCAAAVHSIFGHSGTSWVQCSREGSWPLDFYFLASSCAAAV